MAAGDFSCADLVRVNVKLEDMWGDSAVQAEFKAYADAAVSVLSEQTVNFELLEGGKDRDVRLYWVDSCGITVGNCTDECTITGTVPEATCKDYSISICKETSGLKIPEKAFRSSNLSRDEVVARGFMKHKKALDEEIAKTVIAQIDSFAGANAYTDGVGQVSGTNTFIPPANWTPSVMAYLIHAAQLNKFMNPYLLSGSNLFDQSMLADFNAGNANGSGNAGLMASMRKHFDLFNMDAVLGVKKSFMLDKNSVALVAKNYYEETPIQYTNGADQIRFSVPSDNLAGVRYDVIYKTECVGNEINHLWRFTANFDVFNNPSSICDATRTGVLTFECGVAP